MRSFNGETVLIPQFDCHFYCVLHLLYILNLPSFMVVIYGNVALSRWTTAVKLRGLSGSNPLLRARW